jgi:hypothetical protein
MSELRFWMGNGTGLGMAYGSIGGMHGGEFGITVFCH